MSGNEDYSQKQEEGPTDNRYLETLRTQAVQTLTVPKELARLTHLTIEFSGVGLRCAHRFGFPIDFQKVSNYDQTSRGGQCSTPRLKTPNGNVPAPLASWRSRFSQKGDHAYVGSDE
jgi:hypothetical protein